MGIKLPNPSPTGSTRPSTGRKEIANVNPDSAKGNKMPPVKITPPPKRSKKK